MSSFSGGLDSSIVLRHIAERHPDCVAFTIGAPHSEDLTYARKLTAELGVRHEVIDINPRAIRYRQIRDALEASELTEYGDIINAAISLPLFQRIPDCGIKVAIGGDGSDELFGGYPMYAKITAEQQHQLFLHKIANLGRTELQRVDRASMKYGVEMRVPFLDPAVVELAMRIPGALKVREGVEKWVVRQAFSADLPDYVIKRPKHGLSYSTGLHDRARLFKPLFPRLYRSFGYDIHAPLRRDFDVTLSGAARPRPRARAREPAPRLHHDRTCHRLRRRPAMERSATTGTHVDRNEKYRDQSRVTLASSRPNWFPDHFFFPGLHRGAPAARRQSYRWCGGTVTLLGAGRRVTGVDVFGISQVWPQMLHSHASTGDVFTGWTDKGHAR